MAGHILITTAVLVALAARSVVLVDYDAKLYRAEFWGFGSDLMVGLWVGLLIVALHRWKPTAAAAGMVGWAVLSFLAAEHVRALGAWPDVRLVGMLGDPTFVVGSVLRPAHPFWMAGVALVAGVVVWWVRGLRFGQASRRGLVAAGVVTLAWLLVPAPDDARFGWRGTHFVPENLARLGAERLGPDVLTIAESFPIDEGQRRQVDAWFRADLTGQRLVPPADPARRPNVLLVIIEGLGGDRLGPVPGQPFDPDESPRLAELSNRGFVVPGFISQQRRTNAGLYSMFSGAAPLLQPGTPRMSIFASLPPRRYLPDVLAGHGYRTAYLQSANLRFMAKEPFLYAAGFAEVISADLVRPARAANKWGVDDVTLMEQALGWIDRAQTDADAADGGSPWFLTVLTAGSHHPYLVPEDFPARPGEDLNAQAFRYADHALGSLIDGLEARGLTQDTLVIVTSDEVNYPRDRGRMPWALGEFWGVFIALCPDGSSGVQPGLFGRADTALSVLDYLGLAEVGPPLPGRSVFRDYDTPRALPASTSYRQWMALFSEDGTVDVFTDRFAPVARYVPRPTDTRRGFAALVRDPSGAGPGDASRALLAELTRRQRGHVVGLTDRPLTLMPAGRYTVTPDPDPERGGILTYGHHLVCPRDTLTRVELTFRADPADRLARSEIVLGGFYVPAERTADGRFTAKRTVVLPGRPKPLDFHIRVFTADQQPIDIEIEHAQITFLPLE